MKGFVFKELFHLVEKLLGEATLERLITECNLQSGGAYTSVGYYDYAEIVQLVQKLSEITGKPVDVLLIEFGQFLFPRLAKSHSEIIQGYSNAFDVFEDIERHIHKEVRKLYPNAELPTINSDKKSADEMTIEYRSFRPFAGLAEGLILGCIKYYRELIEVSREEVPTDSGVHVRFGLVRHRMAA